MEIKNNSFREIIKVSEKNEGLVLLGCSGDINEWIEEFTKILKKENICTKEFSFESVHKLTTSGRTDLLLVLPNNNTFDIGKLAMFRLKWGDCSWLSDYVENYADQFY